MSTLMLKQVSPVATHGYTPSSSPLMSKKDGHFSSSSPSSSSGSAHEEVPVKEMRTPTSKNYSINSILCGEKSCQKSLSPESDGHSENSTENGVVENPAIENSTKKEASDASPTTSFLPQLAPFLLQFPAGVLPGMPGLASPASTMPNLSGVGVDPISLSSVAASMAAAGNVTTPVDVQSQQLQSMYLTYMNLMTQFAAGANPLAANPLRLISPTVSLPSMPENSRTQPSTQPPPNVLNPFGLLAQLPQHPMAPNNLATSLSNGFNIHQNHAFQAQNHHGLQLSPNSLMLNKKQSRPTFTGHQIFMLEKKFEQTKYLAGSDRAQLAQELNMSESQVKVWFQNRRTKWRKKEAADNAIIRKENGTSASESPMNRADSQSPMDEPQALTIQNPLLGAPGGNLLV